MHKVTSSQDHSLFKAKPIAQFTKQKVCEGLPVENCNAVVSHNIINVLVIFFKKKYVFTV